MFSTRAVNHKIIRLHERGLEASLNDETSTFNMLSESNTTIIHVKISKKLVIEFYKHLNNFSASIMKEVFTKRILKGADMQIM